MRASLQHHQHNCAVFTVVIRQQHQHFTNVVEQHCNWNEWDSSHWKSGISSISRVSTVIAKSDSIQTSLIEHMGLSMQQVCLVHNLLPLYAKMHCNAEISVQDRSWFHAFKFPRIPQIEIDFTTIQLAVHQWDVDNRVSPLIIFHHRDGVASSFSFLGLLIDCKLFMHKADAAIVKRARPKVRIHLRSQRFYSIANMMVLLSRHMYGVALTLRPQLSTMLQRQLYQYWSHPRIIRHINWRWFVGTKLISMIKQDVHVP